ncbi:MAG: type VI secretion system baseplate subunit TssF [Proteobacteria bacterium]|nr:type VI secretion system baseplate subunit TssF [Pseudomonadota bacterium]
MNTAQINNFLREHQKLLMRGNEFSKQFPKVAGHLSENYHPGLDLHVDRVIEAMAQLSSEIRDSLIKGEQELANTLSSVITPGLFEAFPSSCVVQLDSGFNEKKQHSMLQIAAGELLQSHADSGVNCIFQTVYPVDLIPVNISDITIESPLEHDFLLQESDVNSVMRIRLEKEGDDEFPRLNKLRIYLNGDPMLSSKLYELIFTDALPSYGLLDGKGKPRKLPDEFILPVGFEEDQFLIPQDTNTHPGLRTLVEYFCFPQKFHFIDLVGLEKFKPQSFLDLIIPLKSIPGIDPKRENMLTRCTPVINLFENWLTLPLNRRPKDYYIRPNLTSPDHVEVRSVISVKTTFEDDRSELRPIYVREYDCKENKNSPFWLTRKARTNDDEKKGSEMFLSLRDKETDQIAPADEDAVIHAYCTNRELAAYMPAGTKLYFKDRKLKELFQASCLFRPTPQYDPNQDGESLKVLTSLLKNSAIFYNNDQKALNSLRQLLKICNLPDSRSVARQIEGILEIHSRDQLGRVEPMEAWRGWVKGKNIDVTFDPHAYVGSSCYLFGAILNRFFSITASINSFTKVSIKRVTDEGEWKSWDPAISQQRKIHLLPDPP